MIVTIKMLAIVMHIMNLATIESHHQGELMQKYNLGGKVIFAETDKVNSGCIIIKGQATIVSRGQTLTLSVRVWPLDTSILYWSGARETTSTLMQPLVQCDVCVI